MTDKLKTLIKTLPAVEPGQPVDRLVARIIKRELFRLWERRISLIAAAISVISGIFLAKQILKIARLLGTGEFWLMVSRDRDWLFSEKGLFWQVFYEAHPLKEILFLLLLIAILSFSLYIFLKRDD